METVYYFSTGYEKLIEKIVDDGQAQLNHVILPFGESLPEHASNANTYFLILRGELRLALNGEDGKNFDAGKIVNIPKGVKMAIANGSPGVLEFFIIKAPPPEEQKAALR